MGKPKIIQDPLYQLLRMNQVSDFNSRKASGGTVDLRGCDFRGCDLRELDASGLDLSDCYFRGADLRGIDFRKANLEGASLAHANISGCYFPNSIHANEILLSVSHGIRIRYQ